MDGTEATSEEGNICDTTDNIKTFDKVPAKTEEHANEPVQSVSLSIEKVSIYFLVHTVKYVYGSIHLK